jgi:hypothetical protein
MGRKSESATGSQIFEPVWVRLVIDKDTICPNPALGLGN